MTDAFLDRFDSFTKTATEYGFANGHADRALFLLLREYKDKLPPLNQNFHKEFRTPGVTGSALTDTVIWLLLEQSSAFWTHYERYVEGGK